MAAVSFPAYAQDASTNGALTDRARVVIAQDPRAVVAFQAQPVIVQEMVNNGIKKISGKSDLKAAWLQFVSPKDIIGIKVYSKPGANSGTRPAVVAAVAEGLIGAGIAPSHIIIWDKRLLDLRLAGYSDLATRYGVTIAGAADAGYDPSVSYNNPVMGNLVAGDLDFDLHGSTSGRNSYVTKLLTTNITKIISIAPLLNHNDAGVCGHLYSLAMGSVDNTLRFEASPERLATAVPEIYAKKELSDRVVLNITDALIGQYQGEEMSLLHYSVELNQIWFSKDPVALDVLAIQELDRERQDRKIQPGNDDPDLFRNASFFLELGVGDPSKIKIDLVK